MKKGIELFKQFMSGYESVIIGTQEFFEPIELSNEDKERLINNMNEMKECIDLLESFSDKN